MHLYSYLGLDVCAVSFMYGLIVYATEMIFFFSLTALLSLFGNEFFYGESQRFSLFLYNLI